MRRLVCALIGSSLFVSLLFGGSAVHADLVTNGGFEMRDAGDFTDWTVTSTGTGPQAPTNNLTAAHSGNYGALFAPGTTSVISQVVTVPAAGNYVIDFWLETIFNDDAYLNVFLGGTGVESFVFPDQTSWTEYTVPVVANAGRQTLAFQFTPSGSGPIYFDDVSMTVPEPGTMIAGALLLLPFGAGAIRQLRKKMQAA